MTTNGEERTFNKIKVWKGLVSAQRELDSVEIVEEALMWMISDALNLLRAYDVNKPDAERLAKEYLLTNLKPIQRKGGLMEARIAMFDKETGPK